MSVTRPELFLVFDVESVGLHGEGFAWGGVVVDRRGKSFDYNRAWCPPDVATGTDAGRAWVTENWHPPDFPPLDSPAQVRAIFWDWWQFWKSKGATLAADCAWPVEARFLAACVDDDPAAREWQGPYPLVDVSSVRMAAGLDPLGTVERMPDELPTHDPLCDARQSARLLVEALAWTGMVGESVPSV
jgi:hypothetical protein